MKLTAETAENADDAGAEPLQFQTDVFLPLGDDEAPLPPTSFLIRVFRVVRGHTHRRI